MDSFASRPSEVLSMASISERSTNTDLNSASLNMRSRKPSMAPLMVSRTSPMNFSSYTPS